MEDRLKNYLGLLNDMYGKNITSNMTEYKNNKLFLKNAIELNKAMFAYDRIIKMEGCKGNFEDEKNSSCLNKYEKKGIDFFNRPMEFPGWLGNLDFNNDNPAKKLMIIGEAAGPANKTHVNISFGLGNLYINDKGNLNNPKTNKLFDQLEHEPIIQKSLNKWNLSSLKNYKSSLFNDLWKYLSEIFSDFFQIVKKNTYITDLVMCNNRSNEGIKGNAIWRSCIKNCVNNLLREIEYIRPRVILFQGNNSYHRLKRFIKKNIKEESVTEFYSDKNEYFFSKFPKFGKITFNDLEIVFLKIYHQKYVNSYMPNRNAERQKYKELTASLIKEKIIPLLES